MAKSMWKNKFYRQAYELAKSGMSQKAIAATMGISFPTFISWRKNKPDFKHELLTGRKAYKMLNGKHVSFQDYVYKRLSPELKRIWNKINKLDKAKSGVEKVEAILVRGGLRVRQALFFHAWIVSNFSISSALRKVNISRTTFDRWRNDPEFTALADDLIWYRGNFYEDHLAKLVAGGDTSCTIFVNRTFNRGRGYNEKTAVDVNLRGQLQHNVVSINSMNLPIKTRKEILKAIRGNSNSKIAN